LIINWKKLNLVDNKIVNKIVMQNIIVLNNCKLEKIGYFI